ncbi:MAG: NUDIX hydrolase [Planctomycetes bacterium]|nr:NUDIX hydrolase [Planctomycetota bacterium]
MTIESEQLLDTARFRVVRQTWTTRDGSRQSRAVVKHPGAVTILPMVDDERVCLIRNYRVAVDQTLLELPAGTRSAGEEPAVTAHRELIEETGFRAGSLRELHVFYMSPGILDERMFLFLATDLTAGPAAPEPDEDIETVIVSWQEALDKVDAGEIEDAKTLVALLYYDRLRRGGKGAGD